MFYSSFSNSSHHLFWLGCFRWLQPGYDVSKLLSIWYFWYYFLLLCFHTITVKFALDWFIALDKYARKYLGDRSTREIPAKLGFLDKFTPAESRTSVFELSYNPLSCFIDLYWNMEKTNHLEPALSLIAHQQVVPYLLSKVDNYYIHRNILK